LIEKKKKGNGGGILSLTLRGGMGEDEIDPSGERKWEEGGENWETMTPIRILDGWEEGEKKGEPSLVSQGGRGTDKVVLKGKGSGEEIRYVYSVWCE